MVVKWPSWDNDCITESKIKVSGTMAISQKEENANLKGNLLLESLTSNDKEDFELDKTFDY